MPQAEKKLSETNLIVLDSDGSEVPLAKFVENGPAVLVFLRQFG